MPSRSFSRRLFQILVALAFLLFSFDLWLGLHQQIRLQTIPAASTANE